MKSSLSLPDPSALTAAVHLSRFESKTGVEELHLTVLPQEQGSTTAQAEALHTAYQETLSSLGWDMQTAVFRRFFCSDVQTQAPALQTHPEFNPDRQTEPCAESWVEQPPMPPARMAMWAHHVRDPRGPLTKAWDGSTLTLRRDGLLHHWTTGLMASSREVTAYAQTEEMFEKYVDVLADRGLTLADHVVRTWVYLRDIDANYSGMVDARRMFFAKQGLTPETHYISSTGIEGACEDCRANVFMDAYAVSGLRPEQIRHLQARDHLSPTQVYGVTFERGTALTCPDHTRITISGTASIDRRGQILFPGDVPSQMDRALKNIEALLAEAGAGLNDMQMFTVYLRHPADRAFALWRMRELFGEIPIIVVTAPVCRPGWLIEIEGEALISQSPN